MGECSQHFNDPKAWLHPLTNPSPINIEGLTSLIPGERVNGGFQREQLHEKF